MRGRLIVLFPGAIVALLFVLSRRVPEEIPGGQLLAASTDAVLSFGLAFSLYALLAFTMNQFAADRAGLTLQFLAPIADAELILGKAVGCCLLLVAQSVMCIVSLAAVMWDIPPLSSVGVALGALISYLLLAPVAALASAVLPVRSDLSKTGTGGNPHGFAMLGGTVAIGLLTVAQWRMLTLVTDTGSWGTILVITVATCAALAASALLLKWSATAMASRRENLGLVAQGR